jgi:uncharacterized protein YndB with AHSA1/START domain
VWRALTQGQLITQWLMDNDLEPVVGHRFQFRGTPNPNWNGVIDCEVLIVEPDEKLVYSWNALGLESVVTWTLNQTSNGTMLRMEQSGFRADQVNAYNGASHGWKKFIGELEHIVADLQ